MEQRSDMRPATSEGNKISMEGCDSYVRSFQALIEYRRAIPAIVVAAPPGVYEFSGR